MVIIADQMYTSWIKRQYYCCQVTAGPAAAVLAMAGSGAAVQIRQNQSREVYGNEKRRYLLRRFKTCDRLGTGRYQAGADHTERYREQTQPDRDLCSDNL